MLLTPLICQTWWQVLSEDKWNDLHSTNQTYQCSFVTVSIKDNTIHEGEPYEAEHHFNWETHTPSAGVAGILIHIYGKFKTWKLKLSLMKKVSFKLWSRFSCISGMLVNIQGNRCNQKSQWTLNYSVKQYHHYSGIKGPGYLHYFEHF